MLNKLRCQSDSLIHIVSINLDIEWQTVQIQISWLLKKPTDLDLHYLQSQGISAGQGLKKVCSQRKLSLELVGGLQGYIVGRVGWWGGGGVGRSCHCHRNT